MNRLVVMLVFFCLSAMPVLAAEDSGQSSQEKVQSVFDQVDRVLGNKPGTQTEGADRNAIKKREAKTRDGSEGGAQRDIFQDFANYVTDPSESTTPGDIFLPALTPEIHGWDMIQDDNSKGEQSRKTRAKKLGALRLKEALDLKRAAKLRLVKNRGTEDAIEPEDFSCRDYDCTGLYFIISPEGNLLGVVPKDAISFSSNSFDSSRLISRKTDLGRVRSSGNTSKKVAAKQVRLRLTQRAVRNLLKNRDLGNDLPVIEFTAVCGEDACPSEQELLTLSENVDGAGMITPAPDTADQSATSERKLRQSGKLFLKIPLSSSARGAGAKGRRELAFAVDCQGSCSDVENMVETLAGETGGSVVYPDGTSASYNNNDGAANPSDDEAGKRLHRKLGKPADSTLRKVAVNTRDLSPSVLNGRSFALIIGINNYKYVNKLENCVRDAKGVDEILRTQYGYNTKVILEEKATRDNIMKALNELRKELTENDSLLIYYSGHGHYEKTTDTSYWIPVDAEVDDTTNMLEARSVVDQLKLISAKHVLVVADSCFSGTITRTANIGLSRGTTRENYLNKLFEKTSRVLIASGGNEPVTDGGGEGHSIFAEAFINGLRDPFAQVFTAEEFMTRHLKESVAGRTEQTPEYKVIRNSGHDGGDYVFVRK